METTSKPQISTSSASAPASIHSSSRVVSPTSPVTKPVIPKSKITPINMTPTTTRLMKRTSSSPAPTKQPADPKQSLAQQPSLSRPAVAVTPSIEPAPDADRLHKKARLLITARRMYTSSTTSTALAAEDAAIEEEFDNPTSPTTVAIPRALYSSLVELVEAVHEDLLGSGEESGAGDRGAERGGGIIAGGFAIGIGSLSGAVMVGGAGKKEDVWTAPSPPVEGKRRGVVARASSPAPGRMSSPVTARVASPVPGGGGVVRRSPLGGAATKAPRIQVTQRGVASAERRGLM
ncbi:hypothetical protein BC830DRAFT_625519 [Chytriomyces sp. MP71]|nr:hypothetical protein BC830DRAFT_625519 [Chytriomyces sp. MP71]